MSNPVLNNSIFRKGSTAAYGASGTMTIKGTLAKSILLLMMIVAAGAYTWKVYYESIDPMSIRGWMMGGVFVGFILAMIISFKPKAAPILAPIYAAAEGLALGGVSAIYNNAFAEVAPNIVSNAVLLTLICAFVMLSIYRSGLVKVNGTFMKVLTIALISIMIFYIGSFIISLFGVDMSILHNSSPLSIGISCVITVVAAFCLLSDFHFIEQASAAGAPKYMEWYGAFGLMVTLVWLYLEILKLLAKFSSRE